MTSYTVSLRRNTGRATTVTAITAPRLANLLREYGVLHNDTFRVLGQLTASGDQATIGLHREYRDAAITLN